MVGTPDHQGLCFLNIVSSDLRPWLSGLTSIVLFVSVAIGSIGCGLHGIRAGSVRLEQRTDEVGWDDQ